MASKSKPTSSSKAKDAAFVDVKKALKSIFGHEAFRNKFQEEAVKSVLTSKGKKDIFVSMPTGSGKSLIYQLPGAIAPKGQVKISKDLTLVISSLIVNPVP